MMCSRVLVSVVSVWVITAFFACGVHAGDKYPAKGIEIVVPLAPGGMTGTMAAIFADEFGKELNTSVVTVHKTGASGTVGATAVTQSRKDGYTLLVGSGSGMTMAPHLLPNVPYSTLKDFNPITIIGTSPNIIYVKNDSPIKSYDTLVEMARKDPEKLTFGSAGTGSDVHFFMEQLQLLSGLRLSHIPYKGGGEVLPAVLGGHVDMGVSLMATIANQIKATTVRGIIIGDTKKHPIFKDIPLTSEKGFSQSFLMHWDALFAPAGVPQTVLEVLTTAANKVIRSKNFVKRLEDLGCGVKYVTPQEFRTFISEEEKIAVVLAKEIKRKGK